MRYYKLFVLTVLVTFFASCGSESENPNDLFAVVIKEAKKSYKTADNLNVSVQNKKNKSIESISYSIDGVNPIVSEGNSAKDIALNGERMGKHQVTASITSDGTTYDVSKEIIITATKTPTLYGYRILETYPHDINAFTQGLEFENDTLYESTGQRKKSTLRMVDYLTGEVLKKQALEDQFFAEGITILQDKIYQLTWQRKTGFIYDLHSFDKTGSFVYGSSEEGWGLCNDGTSIFKSDGTEKIWTLDPSTLAEKGHIELYTNTSKIPKVNELEWVDGKIYANIWQKSAIAIVNPTNGAVEGVIDMKGLQEQVTQHETLDVLNGIAYKGEPNILYVTGKNWDKLFKIEVISK